MPANFPSDTPPPGEGEIEVLIARLRDLHRQATEERSHYYTGKCIRDAIAALTATREEVARLREAIGYILPLAESWANGKSQSHPDHECVEFARAALTTLPTPGRGRTGE